ncbi:hypothetical protein MAM1_0258c08840 [Mucor ambiguus]|uniref:RNA polymerase II elongation factor ELL N-terminal domain-containing protein n=1 Tax=Mucor ambiguus TaxID=91626 RepID=A0A0C9LWY1_9FUNG|nr:hypothetical protein MAM1_0258c08840 [Mucor ambiguus]
MAGEKIINFKLDGQTIEKLTKQKSLHVAYKKSGVLEIVMDDARIRLDTMKGSTSPRAATATYYNNNSSTLHYLGDTVVATPTVRKIQEEKKPKSKDSAEQRDKVTRLLDIPSTTTASTAPETKSKTISSLKKSSINKKSKSSSSIPPTPTTPLSASSSSSRATHKTSKSTKSFDPPVTKTTAPLEEKYSMKSRILQRLAIKPWSLIEMTKSLNRSQLERCDQLEVKHILDMVAFPIKKDERKKFCLKPKHYKDIQIWTWPFYSNEDKKIAAENAKEAYDLLQSQGVDSDRSNLYHPDSPYKPPAITSPMLANSKKIASPLNSRKTSFSSSSSSAQQQHQEKGKGRLTPVDHASPSTPLMKLAASPLQNKPITPTPPSSTMTPPPLPSSSQSTPTQHHLKPSSANKKYASKALPQQNGTTSTASIEKLSPPTKRKNMVMDDVDVPSRDALAMPTPRHKKRTKDSASSTSTPPVSKSSRMSLPLTPTAATPTPPPATVAPPLPPPPPPRPAHKEPTSIKPLNIKSQHKFNAYCHSYVKQQKDYIRIKRFFKSNFPQYIQVLQSTEPPKGTKRSYYDLNAEYQAMLKSSYLKQGDDEQAFKEAQDFLVDCHNKRRRLNYMWSSIKQNLDEHQYTIPKSLCK